MLSNVFIYSVGPLITKAAGFFLLPVYTGLISVAEYGSLGVLQTTQTLVTTILGLGLVSALSRIYYDNIDQEEKQAHVATIYWFVFLVVSLFTLASYPLSQSYNSLVFRGELPLSLVYLLAFSFLPLMLMNTSMSLLQIQIRPTLFSSSQILSALTYHMLAIVLLVKGFGLSGIMAAGITSAVTVSIFVAAYLRQDISPRAVRLKVLKPMMVHGLPLMLIALVAWLIDLSDRFFLNHYISQDEVGLYSLANQIVSLMVFINMVFMQAVPIYLFKVRESDQSLGEQLQAAILRYYLIITLGAALVLTLLSKNLVAILSPPDYFEANTFIPLLSLSQVFLGCFYVLHVGIANAKKFHYLLYCFTVSGAVNLVLNYLLIPRYSGGGAAAATAISYLVLAGAGGYFSQKVYPLPWEFRPAFKLFFAFFICVGVGLYGSVGSQHWDLLRRVAVIACYVPLAWWLGLTHADRQQFRIIISRGGQQHK